MDSQPLGERRKEFKQYKADVRAKGKSFYPYAILHDTLMSGVVVAVIIGLAVIWRYTIPGDHTAPVESGTLGPTIDLPADPGTTSFVPRPDWYFYFLFYLLRVFKWPETVVIATVGVPTVCLILLGAMPFIDTRAERNPLKRPVALVAAILVVISMGVLTWKGAVAKESLGSELVAKVPEWAQVQGFADNPDAVAGAKLFAQSGCTSCHTYLGEGSSNLSAPDLSAEGAKNKGIEFQIKHLKCPSCETPGSAMSPFADLGDQNLKQIATFLEASKGPKPGVVEGKVAGGAEQADAAGDGAKIVKAMLVVGLIFLAVILIGEFVRYLTHRKKKPESGSGGHST